MGSTPTLEKNPVSSTVQGGGCFRRAVRQTLCLVTLASAVPGVESLGPRPPQSEARPGIPKLPLHSLGAAGFSVLSMTQPLFSFLASFVSPGCPFTCKINF